MVNHLVNIENVGVMGYAEAFYPVQLENQASYKVVSF